MMSMQRKTTTWSTMLVSMESKTAAWSTMLVSMESRMMMGRMLVHLMQARQIRTYLHDKALGIWGRTMQCTWGVCSLVENKQSAYI